VFRLVSPVGIAASNAWQPARLAGDRFRPLQSLDPSTSSPLERIRPPSEPSRNSAGFPGTVTIACWSGWIPST
jgi:hypothetical protein